MLEKLVYGGIYNSTSSWTIVQFYKHHQINCILIDMQMIKRLVISLIVKIWVNWLKKNSKIFLVISEAQLLKLLLYDVIRKFAPQLPDISAMKFSQTIQFYICASLFIIWNFYWNPQMMAMERFFFLQNCHL